MDSTCLLRQPQNKFKLQIITESEIKPSQISCNEINQSELNKPEPNEGDFQNTNDLFEGDLINIGENPTTLSWKFIPLFKEGSSGEIRVWQIGFQTTSSQSSQNNNLKIVHGTLITSKGNNGKLITNYHPIEINQSGRNLQQQALLEARRRYLDQMKNGYCPRGEELPAELNGIEPMLAKSLKLNSDSTKCKSNETKLLSNEYPVSVMPKFDGIRALVKIINEDIFMKSRNNHQHEAPLEHIKAELKLFFSYLPPNCELDGELYSMDLSFNELSGIIRTKKGKHKKHDKVKFYIFDIIEAKNLPWETRYSLLVNAYQKYLEDGNSSYNFQIIQTYTVNNEKELMTYHDNFVKNGYEGIIIRRYACTQVKCCRGKDVDLMCKNCQKVYKLSIYRSNRTKAMLKYKLFTDEEVIITGFEAGVGTEEGAIIYKVKDLRGNVFTIRPRGSMEERRQLYIRGNELIGKPLTIRYQELSEFGVPRFPVAIAIRDYE